ncbi:MAG: hypothetical protein WDM91_11105 [Rhizomicrobium sp.]
MEIDQDTLEAMFERIEFLHRDVKRTLDRQDEIVEALKSLQSSIDGLMA